MSCHPPRRGGRPTSPADRLQRRSAAPCLPCGSTHTWWRAVSSDSVSATPSAVMPSVPGGAIASGGIRRRCAPTYATCIRSPWPAAGRRGGQVRHARPRHLSATSPTARASPPTPTSRTCTRGEAVTVALAQDLQADADALLADESVAPLERVRAYTAMSGALDGLRSLFDLAVSGELEANDDPPSLQPQHALGLPDRRCRRASAPSPNSNSRPTSRLASSITTTASWSYSAAPPGEPPPTAAPPASRRMPARRTRPTCPSSPRS
jgi:hypothetical protein